MRAIPAILVLAALAACGSEGAGTTVAEGGDESSYSVERNGDSVEVRATGQDGEEVIVAASAHGSASLPLGFTVYPGAKVVSNSTIETHDGKGSVLYLTTPASREDVTRFYRGQAEAAGIAIATQSTNNAAHSIAGEGSGGKTFMMTASTTPAGTGVQLMIGVAPGS